MNRIFYVFVMAILVFAFSCTQKPKPEAEAASEAEPVAGQPTSAPSVLNPNFATEDQLMGIELIDEVVGAMIVDSRPLLNVSDFTKILLDNLDSAEVKEVCKSLFLPLNLNTATKEEILMVPGVGDKMAHEFEEYRPYKSIDQFRREIGKYVSDDEVAEYEKYVFVPINLNTGSKDEILSIPGVGDKMLHEFEEYRPYQSMEQFRREIGKYVDDNELSRLERYVTLD